MKQSNLPLIIFCLALALVFIGPLAGAWYSATVEARVFNRCHPSTPITAWEALWTRTRIDNCETKERAGE